MMKRALLLTVCLIAMSVTVAFTEESGFQVGKNGFGFENYANRPGIANLTPAEVVRLFGPGADADEDEDEIILTPAAEQWMEDINRAINIGHCEGLAVLSYLFHLGILKPSAFGGETAHDLKLEGNEALQHEIAYWWSTQCLEPTRGAKQSPTPKEVLDLLREGLPARDPEKAYTLAIWKADLTGGHAVTPYAVEDGEGDESKILIYDNNFPNQERFILVDRAADTWSYSTAVNPNERVDAYVGDAETRTLRLTPLSVRMRTQQADFIEEAEYADEEGLEKPEEDTLQPGAEAPDDDEEGEGEEEAATEEEVAGGAAAAGTGPVALADAKAGPAGRHDPLRSTPDERKRIGKEKYWMEIALTGEGADLLITDADGKRIGKDRGKFVNEIPGAEAVRFMGPFKSPDADPEPRYRLPGGRDYLVSIVGTGTQPEPVSVSCLGRGTELVVEDITVEPGKSDTVFFSPDGSRVAYRPSGDEHPTLEAGYTSKGPDFEISTYGVETSPGAIVELEIVPKRGVAKVQVHGSKEPASVAVEIERIARGGSATYKNDDLALEPGDAAYFHFAAWKGDKSPMSVDIDRGGDGKIDVVSKWADE